MIYHSVLCLGWLRIAEEEFLLLWDTQDTDLLGWGDTGLSLLPAVGLDMGECVILKSVQP